MTVLRLGEQLSLSTDVATMSVLILGKKGSGKTNTIVVMAEELYRVHIPVCIWDPTGKHYGIKSRADGKGPGLPFYIFGGVHQDLPLYPESGAQIADVFLDKGISMVLDVQAFSGTEKARFITAFANQMFKRGPENEQRGSARHVLMEEADQFFPQNPYKGEEPMLGAVSKLYRLGRNYWYGFTILSQRSAKIHKDGTTQADILLALRTTGPQDQKVVEDWLKYHHLEDQKRQAMEQLASLPTGTAIVWWPEEGVFKTASIRHRSTLDTTSSRPTVKRTIPKNPVLAAVDLEQLRKDMAQAIERRKQEDPVELRRRIVELEKQLGAKNKNAVTAAGKPQIVKETTRIEIPTWPEGVRDRLFELETAIRHAATELAVLARVKQGKPVTTRETGGVKLPGSHPASIPQMGAQAARAVTGVRVQPHPPVSRPIDGNGHLGIGEQKVLTVLAQWPDGRSQRDLAFLTGYSAGASTIGVILSKLRKAGLVAPGQPVRATEAGLAYVGGVHELPTGPELLQHWLSHPRIGEGERKVLLTLIEAFPEALTHDELAEKTNYSPIASTLGVILSKLRKLGLVEKGARRASPSLVEAVR